MCACVTLSSIRSGGFGWNTTDPFHALHKAAEDILFLGDISSVLRHLSVDTLTGLVNSGIRNIPQPLDDSSSESSDSDSSDSSYFDDDDDEPCQKVPPGADKESEPTAAPEKSSEPVQYEPTPDPQPSTSGQ